MLLGRARLPAELGAGVAAAGLHRARRAFGTDWLLRMWNDRTRTLYYQVGIGEGNDQIAGDHDIWRLPQADDTLRRRRTRVYRYIRHRPVFRAGPPGSPVSPNLAGRDAAAFALCYQVFRASDPALRAPAACAPASTSSPRRHRPEGDLLTVDPVRLLSRDASGATTSSSARPSSHDRARLGGRPPPGCRTTRRATTCAWPRTGRTPTSTARNDAADTLNLYDV